ncbi:MAG: AbrB/MazE/SpoVT family DNA-binding domain-containing protein [Candidatus Brockarchaeota archaeon]|nr:AbrB/MazE/SpoVT family DNA-binding domain-containing protein [Candidatus Brockarchaeota archaeon]
MAISLAPWRRAVQETGGGSLAVTLPKGWADAQGVRKGSYMLIVANEDGSLRLLPERGEMKKEASCAIISNSPNLVRDVLGGYLLGFDVLRLESPEPFPAKTVAEVRRAVRRLSGAEIVEELPRRIEIQVLLDPEVVAPEKVLRREGTLVESMVADASASLLAGDVRLAGSTVERDEEVDRQYFILVRMVRSAIRDPEITRRMGINPLRLLDMRLVARFLESSGDEAAAIASLAGEVGGLSEGMRDMLASLGNHALDLVRKSAESFLSMDPSAASQIFAIFQETRDIARAIESSPEAGNSTSGAAVSKAVPRFERIAENSMDIAELAPSILSKAPATLK